MGSKKIESVRIHLDNGYDYFFSDDKYFGFKSAKQAIEEGYNLCMKLKNNVKVVMCTTYDNQDYKDEVIAKFDYKKIIKAEKIKIKAI